jgi:hypothetical protein
MGKLLGQNRLTKKNGNDNNAQLRLKSNPLGSIWWTETVMSQLIRPTRAQSISQPDPESG